MAISGTWASRGAGIGGEAALQRSETRQPGAVAAAIEHRSGEPDAPGGDGAQAQQQRRIAGHRDQFQPEGMRQQIVEMQNAAAFLGAQIAEREQAAEPAPAGAIAWIDEDVGRAVGEHQPRARVIAQGQILLALGQMRAHHAGHRIAIAKSKAGKAEMGRLHHQFLGMRGAAQEGEIRGDGEFEVTH